MEHCRILTKPNQIQRLLPRISRTFSQVIKSNQTDLEDVHNISLNQNLHGFILKEITDIPEYKIRAFNFEHEKTKTPYLHLQRDDSNNLFSIHFRTTPKDSTGLPHILEHTVLCGSELFPVRDPFFKMLNRSLATFMNAFTGPDYTVYPFSTQNYTDYINLQRVYLDAVFNPKLSELDFMQEGWRLENVDPNDVKSPLTIKGVVYNEMKGVFSENESIFAQHLQNLILPDDTYGVVSGGDPLTIPHLTWNALKQFHKEQYHPSNCRCLSYGNFPVAPSLKYLNDMYFSKYAYYSPSNTIVPKQKRWNKPKREHVTCRFDAMGDPIEKQNYIAISLLLSDCTDVYETFLMQFISELLVKGPNSSFYSSLIEPNFSGGFTPSTGLSTHLLDTLFTISLKGLKKEYFEKVEHIFDETINQVVQNGFNKDHVDAVLHNYEIMLKHETENFGLNLLFTLVPLWNHTNKVTEGLEISKLLEKLKYNVKTNPNYLQKKVEEAFKNNPHRLVLTMSPDLEYERKFEKQEKELVQKKVKGLSEKDKEEIYKQGIELQEFQKVTQNSNLLPTLTLTDIKTDIDKIDTVHVTLNNVKTYINKVNTNGIVYFKSILTTNKLSQEQNMLLPLFCHVITKLGSDRLNFKELDSLINKKTGAFSVCPHVAESLYDLHTYEPGIMLSSFCLEQDVEDMWAIWSQILNVNKLEDVERFKTLVQLYVANLTNDLTDSGHLYAIQAAANLVSSTAHQVELLSGLQHIFYMKRLVQTSNYRAMLGEILNMAKIIFDKNNMRVAINLTPEKQSQIIHTFDNFVGSIPRNSNPIQDNVVENSYVVGKTWNSSEVINCQHHVHNIPVNYCSKALLTVPYSDPDYASLKVLAKLISSKYLHPEIREKRGAYGSGAKLSLDGVFSFYSYRDPNNVETLNVFDKSFEWFQTYVTKCTDQDLLEAKLGVFQAVDAPTAPGAKGCEDFAKKLSPDRVKRHRADIMCVEKKNLAGVSERYLGEGNRLRSGKVVIGPKDEKIEKAKRASEIWTVVENDLM